MRPLVALGLALFVAACAQEPREITLRLVTAEAIGCQPTAVQSVVLRPLGDTAPALRPSVRLDLSEVSRITGFEPNTIQVSVRAEGFIEGVGGGRDRWTGGGFARLDGQGELVVPLLRLRRGCPVSDRVAHLVPGSSAAPLPDGRLLITGGRRGAEDLRVVVITLGEPLARVLDLGARPRVNGSATALDEGRVLLAGGLGRESFEVVAIDAESVVSEGLLRGPRSQHGAARMTDGRVLLVGGRSETGEARRDAELVDVTGSDRGARRTLGSPIAARIGPEVLALDDGTVLVLGGADGEGAPISSVERFDPELETFTPLHPWPPVEEAAYAALAGGRVARVGRDEAGVQVSLLLDRGETHVRLLSTLPAELERIRAIGLVDGRLLVTGSRAGAPFARIIDPGATRDEAERGRTPLEPARVPAALVRLADGAIAELDEAGLSLLRVDLQSPFDDPPESLRPAQVNQRAALSLDGPRRWRGEADVLVADVDGARLDLPVSRFSDFEATLESVGTLQLLLTRQGHPARVVEIDERAQIGECGVAVGGPVTVRRVGRSLRLSSGEDTIDCLLPDGLGRMGIGVRARSGGGVRRLSVRRL